MPREPAVMKAWRCKSGSLAKLPANRPFKQQYIGFDCVGFIDGREVQADVVGISIPKKGKRLGLMRQKMFNSIR